MRVGITTFPADWGVGVGELAREVEARGFESLWLPEHSHIPTSRKSAWPGATPGDETLPEVYAHLVDPLVALSVAAGATERIRLGTSVLLPAQHDPLRLAKQIATLDLLSGGRLELGIGFGWNAEQFANHGVDFATRRAATRETMLAMKALWRDDAARFEGEHVRFEESWSWPKPVQRPHPPIWLGGGWGPVLFRHVAEYTDGWMPISARASLRDRAQGMERAAEAVGRDPATLGITVMGAREERGALESLASEGVHRAAFNVPCDDRDDCLRALDRLAPLAAPFSS